MFRLVVVGLLLSPLGVVVVGCAGRDVHLAHGYSDPVGASEGEGEGAQAGEGEGAQAGEGEGEGEGGPAGEGEGEGGR